MLEEIRQSKTNEQIDALIYNNKGKEKAMNGNYYADSEQRDDVDKKKQSEKRLPDGNTKYLVVIENELFWCDNTKDILKKINEKYETLEFDGYDGSIPMPKIYNLYEAEYNLFCKISVEDIDMEY